LAISIAISASVTVSMAALAIGIFSPTFLEILDSIFTSSGNISEYPVVNRTSSYVRAMPWPPILLKKASRFAVSFRLKLCVRILFDRAMGLPDLMVFTLKTCQVPLLSR
jgi:hypothetical protein